MQTSLNPSPLFITLGRMLLASLFILGGINKLLNFEPTLARMTQVGLQPAALLLPLTIALELGGGLLVAYGKRWASLAALALTIFTLATNLIFHRFWEMAPPLRELELSLFFKNVSITGALLLITGLHWPRKP
jgi:putative oxidoreductase